jgi:hypothetical protein
MKILKKKKGLYAYSGTDAEAIKFLTAFKQVFGVDLLPFLGDKPISAPLADSLRAFDEDADNILPEVGTENRQTLIDSGALDLLFKINGQQGSIIGYIYELKNWYANKLTTGKVVYKQVDPLLGSSPYAYMYIPNKVINETQFNALAELEIGDIMKQFKINLTTPFKTWDNILKTYGFKEKYLTKYNKYFYDNLRDYIIIKLRSIQPQTDSATGSGTNDASGASNNPTETYIEGNLIENDALAFLHEIEKNAPINWGNLQYWYKQLLTKKKEVSKEVFAFAYDYWLKKLNAEYMTFDAAKKEKEKPDYDLINGFIFERPKPKKKYGILATILRKIFNKK